MAKSDRKRQQALQEEVARQSAKAAAAERACAEFEARVRQLQVRVGLRPVCVCGGGAASAMAAATERARTEQARVRQLQVRVWLTVVLATVVLGQNSKGTASAQAAQRQQQTELLRVSYKGHALDW